MAVCMQARMRMRGGGCRDAQWPGKRLCIEVVAGEGLELAEFRQSGLVAGVVVLVCERVVIEGWFA